ncbi:unnamed protein product, partial [Trichogramma brassicae]
KVRRPIATSLSSAISQSTPKFKSTFGSHSDRVCRRKPHLHQRSHPAAEQLSSRTGDLTLCGKAFPWWSRKYRTRVFEAGNTSECYRHQRSIDRKIHMENLRGTSEEMLSGHNTITTWCATALSSRFYVSIEERPHPNEAGDHHTYRLYSARQGTWYARFNFVNGLITVM